jgi:hypothetical protein
MTDYASLIDRLRSKYEPDLSGCWIWIGTVGTKGYGRIAIKGKLYQAHRIVYELLVGPIPNGLQLDHVCRNRLCVNPAHCEPVDNKTNVLRGIGFAAQNAKKTHCSKGHLFDSENTRITNTGRRKCMACDREYARLRYWKPIRDNQHGR